MFKKFFFILLSLFPFFQNVNANISTEDFLQEIFQNAEYCIKSYDEERVFLKSENLHFTDEGLLLDLNGFDSMALPYIFSEGNRSYIWRASEMFQIFKNCALCGNPYFVKCKNSDCPSNQK